MQSACLKRLFPSDFFLCGAFVCKGLSALRLRYIKARQGGRVICWQKACSKFFSKKLAITKLHGCNFVIQSRPCLHKKTPCSYVNRILHGYNFVIQSRPCLVGGLAFFMENKKAASLQDFSAKKRPFVLTGQISGQRFILPKALQACLL